MLQIRLEIEERLSPRWSEAFDGLTIEHRPGPGGAVISGLAEDYASLYGVLGSCRDLGLRIRFLEVEENA